MSEPQSNAVRHVTWQASVTNRFGRGIATEIGNTHEDNPNVNLKQRTFTGEDAGKQADQSVDLLNNIIGRHLGENNPNASQKYLAISALELFHTEGLYTATEHKNKEGEITSVTIGKTRLTDKEYKSAMKRLNETDKDGFSKAQLEKQASDFQKERNMVIK